MINEPSSVCVCSEEIGIDYKFPDSETAAAAASESVFAALQSGGCKIKVCMLPKVHKSVSRAQKGEGGGGAESLFK